MIKRFSLPIIKLAVPLTVSGILLFSGVAKLRDPIFFLASIAKYDLVSSWLIGSVGIFVPWLEISVGISLFFRRFSRAAYLAAGGLCLVFGLAQLSVLFRGLQIPCGCFGPTSEPELVGAGSVLRLLIVGMLAIAGYFLTFEKPSFAVRDQSSPIA